FIPNLGTTLAKHNAAFPDLKFRLRAVLHAGDVHLDPQGWFGEAVDVTFRLLDAKAVKRRLAHSPAPLALVVSDHIYRTVILQRYNGIEPNMYTQVVRVRVGRGLHAGRVHTLGVPADAVGKTATATVIPPRVDTMHSMKGMEFRRVVSHSDSPSQFLT
ncbi:MAG: hypothetical protein ACRD0P_20385, partial [Stackebrandtia sp.]